jgi:hypothetical protein
MFSSPRPSPALRMRIKKIIGFAEINSYVEKSRTIALESTLLA